MYQAGFQVDENGVPQELVPEERSFWDIICSRPQTKFPFFGSLLGCMTGIGMAACDAGSVIQHNFAMAFTAFLPFFLSLCMFTCAQQRSMPIAKLLLPAFCLTGGIGVFVATVGADTAFLSHVGGAVGVFGLTAPMVWFFLTLCVPKCMDGYYEVPDQGHGIDKYITWSATILCTSFAGGAYVAHFCGQWSVITLFMSLAVCIILFLYLAMQKPGNDQIFKSLSAKRLITFATLACSSGISISCFMASLSGNFGLFGLVAAITCLIMPILISSFNECGTDKKFHQTIFPAISSGVLLFTSILVLQCSQTTAGAFSPAGLGVGIPLLVLGVWAFGAFLLAQGQCWKTNGCFGLDLSLHRKCGGYELCPRW